jgi:hypothetical protein
VASHLDDGDAVLIVDETADEKSSGNAAGAARQYSGTVGGIALCQVAVTLTYATGRELRRGIRERGLGYVLAVRANHVVTAGSGRTVTAAAAARMIPARAWHRMRTGSGTKGTGTTTGRCWR